MPEERYELVDRTYDRLAVAGISVLSVLEVLYGRAVLRRHIGSALQVVGTDRAGEWLAVSLIETSDDRYTVTGARRLDADEIAAVARMRREQP